MTSASFDLDRELAAAGARGHQALAAAVIDSHGHRHHGWARDGAGPGRSTLFEIGSITKVFTGVLLADMHLRGEVSLQDPLSRHLTSPGPAWRHGEPTLLQLATHRSGLPNTPAPLHRRELGHALGLRRQNPWTGVGDQDYRRLVALESPRAAPDARFRYSSMGVGLLGEALSSRVGTPYGQLLTERVLEPLGMRSTAVKVPPAWAPRVLDGHSSRGRPRPPIQDLMPAAGSLHSTADDMLRFLAACLQPPPGQLGAAMTLAQRPYARISARMQVGLCWMVMNPPSGPGILWHNGGTWGFRSFIGLTPELGAAAVVLANTARSVDRLGLRLIDHTARS